MEHSKVQFNKNSEERRKKRVKYLFVLLILFLVIAVGIVAFLRNPTLQITQVTVTGTRALNQREITDAAYQELAGNYWLVIPKKNTLIFSKGGMRDYLLQKYPGIRDLHVSFVNQTSISIEVRERESATLWCSEGACYFVDSTGIVYREAPTFSDGVYISYTGTLIENGNSSENSPTLIGTRFVTAGDFNTLEVLKNKLAAFPLRIFEIHIDQSRDVALRVGSIAAIPIASTAQILITLDQDPNTVIDNLKLLTGDASFAEAIASRGNDLEKIDLRFPGKIFYKFKTNEKLLETPKKQ